MGSAWPQSSSKARQSAPFQWQHASGSRGTPFRPCRTRSSSSASLQLAHDPHEEGDMRLVAVALLTLLLAACSEPRIDATSEATLDASIAKVRETLAIDQRSRFDALVAQTRADDAADESPATSA